MFYKDKALKIRKSKKLNSGYVANALNVSTSTLWSWENGRRNPSNENIIKLAKILDVPLTEISDLKQYINSNYNSMLSNEFDNISEIFSKNKELTLTDDVKIELLNPKDGIINNPFFIDFKVIYANGVPLENKNISVFLDGKSKSVTLLSNGGYSINYTICFRKCVNASF